MAHRANKVSAFMKPAIVALVVLISTASAAAEGPRQDRTLFNGTDLTGWTGTAGFWSVKDGAIVGRAENNLPHSEFLWSSVEVKDFYLSVEVKLEPDSGTAGIHFRSSKMDNRPPVRGYQAGLGKGWWGRLFHEGLGKLDWLDRGEKAVKPGQWNRYEILAVGPRLWIAINGKLSIAHSDSVGDRTGHLALVLHAGPAVTVAYRIDKLVHNPRVALAGLTEQQLDAEIGNPPYSIALVKTILADARARGDARRGAGVFRSATLGCMSCHQVGGQGGTVGPDLSAVGKCLSPEEIVESVLWPKRQVKPEYVAIAVTTRAGRTLQGYKESENATELFLREPGTKITHRFKKSQMEERREVGTLMPDRLVAAISPEQRRDLIRFLLELGHTEGLAAAAHAHVPAPFPYDRAPLEPDRWPNWKHPVNRDRLYDFYTKEAAYFRKQRPVPPLLPEFPGLDGGKQGHWGNQKEASWVDDRWNRTDLGSVMCGVFRGAGVTVPRGVCVRLGKDGELAACFNPDTLCYEALWRGGFVKLSSVRHGFMHGLLLDGKPLERPAGKKPDRAFVYHGYYRHGKRVIFSYRLGDVEMLDAPWTEDGKFSRQVAPAARHPLAHLTRGGPAQWPQVIKTKGARGQGKPYAVDSLTPPFDNPWKALLFFGGHDFAADGTAFLCTMQGDVWRVEGIDDRLERLRWRRIASGLHHALGLVVADRSVYVLGRDQITRLVDRNGDGETDFYECFSNAFTTSAAGHDFICGLERDAAGNFYTASGNQGLLRIGAGGKKLEVLATGFRNPDGLGLLPGGAITVPCSEGEWTPASMICEVRPARKSEGKAVPSFGYGGPRNGKPPELPLVYLPRGLDNSSGGQAIVPDERWGPLKGQAVHFSYGAGTHFLLLRDEVAGQSQGAVVPLAGEFLSGAHRGRFNPRDGQLYVTGMAGWGTYTVADGSFQRVRYTCDPVQLPSGFHVHENGVLVKFTRPLDRDVAARAGNHFAQCWNYRYSAAYGSPEYSPRHPGTKGHDPLAITSAHVLADGRSLFLEIPDLQPVNQLHLQLRVGSDPACNLFVTVHKMDKPFSDFPGYRPVDKVIAAHPILTDLAALTAKKIPNPWRRPLPNARAVGIEAGKNLTFSTRTLTVRSGEPIKLTFTNPDVVPHNWVLIRPGALERVGDLANKIVADSEAAVRQYVPSSPDVLAYTDVVPPQKSFTIHFRAPAAKGRYPFLCTFPGHWMVMNGQLIVE
jgi:putative heme-binding domain-containing protein